MAIYDYKYYIEGREIAVLQRSLDTAYDPYLKVSDELYLTPTVADTNALLVWYTVSGSSPANENALLPVNDLLGLGVVSYVKHKLAQENKDYKVSFAEYNEFLKYVRMNQNRKEGSHRISIPNGVWVVK